MNYCSYGCNQKAKYKLKNGKYCCCNHHASCPALRKKNSISNSGDKNGMYGRKHSDETKKKIGEKSKQKIFDGSYRNKLRQSARGNKRRLGIKHSQETKDLMSETRKGNPLSEKNKRGISKALKGRIFTKEWRQKLSDTRKRNFKDPKFLKQFKKSISQKPTSIEKIINILVKSRGYKYVGDFSTWVDGKNPDFINESDKKIIEVFGDYWHKAEDEYIRYKHFKKNGYKLLVIWEHEIYENFENVKRRFFKFDYKEQGTQGSII
ncbi:MAG TPA: NUMOD3 domain-containing DNA-binding protein [Candidatus Glassbacteria bacterium]|nr:NUMOD3 domain-containing DNA-binding protein [Candidatus Glassbacteria bacterium]